MTPKQAEKAYVEKARRERLLCHAAYLVLWCIKHWLAATLRAPIMLRTSSSNGYICSEDNCQNCDRVVGDLIEQLGKEMGFYSHGSRVI
jgi:hypothetical protein